MKRKIRPRVDAYAVIARAVEEGIAWGLRRHDKYAETPLTGAQRDSLADELDREIMNALCEVLCFAPE